jgi:hypothetical protein
MRAISLPNVVSPATRRQSLARPHAPRIGSNA